MKRDGCGEAECRRRSRQKPPVVGSGQWGPGGQREEQNQGLPWSLGKAWLGMALGAWQAEHTVRLKEGVLS